MPSSRRSDATSELARQPMSASESSVEVRPEAQPDSEGTGEAAPAIVSCASFKSSATFSARINSARRSASVFSSPDVGASAVNSMSCWERQPFLK